MKIHILQHVEFENPGCILNWAKERKHNLTVTKLFEEHEFPSTKDFDFLIIMGGPMGVYDYDKYSWLREEKVFIINAIANNKIVLGICLGAQLIADVLGARVYKNDYTEIGWFPMRKITNTKHNFFDFIPDNLNVFHWHGDTFYLPKNAENIFESEGCKNQAFVLKEKVFGLQFHLEVTKTSIQEMIKKGKHELINDKFIQLEKEILENENIEKCNKIMFNFLDKIEENFS